MLLWMEVVRWAEVGIRVGEMVTERSHVWVMALMKGRCWEVSCLMTMVGGEEVGGSAYVMRAVEGRGRILGCCDGGHEGERSWRYWQSKWWKGVGKKEVGGGNEVRNRINIWSQHYL